MTSSLLFSAAAGCLTTALAWAWAILVSDGMGCAPETDAAEQHRDIRTW